MSRYITRIAPSPTGMMHIGTARTALFNWLAAKATGGRFILRIDDTDADRNMEEAVKPIYEGLQWLGLDWDDSFRQSEPSIQAMLHKSAHKLLVDNLAIEAENGAVLLKWHPNNPQKFEDEVGGTIDITDTNIEQIDGRLVLLRGKDKDYAPTYQFASIVNDMGCEVNYIIRGVDHISNTPKQLAVKWALERSLKMEIPIKLAHVGLIFKDKKKMSKRDGAASLLDYRDKGYHPDAVFNFLLRMGWGPREDNKANSVLSREQAVDMFLTQGRMRAANANFDQNKLDWYNKIYSK